MCSLLSALRFAIVSPLAHHLDQPHVLGRQRVQPGLLIRVLLGLRLGQASDALVERACFAELSEAERAALGAAVERFGGFLGLSHSPALQQAYRLREELTRLFDTARSKADGMRRLRFWRQRVERSGLDCFDGFLKLLDRWQDRIANYFVARESSGFVEGLNTKLKVLKRRCYGLRNVGRLFQRLTLDLDGYRRFAPWATGTY